MLMRKLLILHIILLFSLAAWSQNPATAYPYECSFEASENLSAWQLNPQTPTAMDQWIIGTAVHSEGRRALYISSDGQNDVMGKTTNVTVAYLRYKFPEAGNYDFSFDWKGIGDSISSKLYVLYCPETDFLSNTSSTNYYDINKIVSSTSGVLSQNVIDKACQYLGESGEKFVCGSASWQNVSFAQPARINARNADKVFVFVFIWMSSNSSDAPKSSIAIDNVQINSAGIPKPTELVVYPQCEDSSLLVTWKTENSYTYDIHYRKVGESTWRMQNGISEGPSGYTRNQDGSYSYSLKKILEGSYDVRIRGKYYDDIDQIEWQTNFVYQTNILVYCPENHCINYINYHDPTKVTCTYGYYDEWQAGATAYDNVGIIDYGPDSRESRHTLHVDPTEVDPRTDSLLNTVPQGAMASVRLGNWNTGGEAEAITYDLLVDTSSQGILIIKYAVVLNKPNPSCGDPGFKLVLLDSLGHDFGNGNYCGKADFSYTAAAGKVGENGWHQSNDGQVVWKEWTTVGISLMDHHGEHIKVRFTTNDCGGGGHYAYAYFVLDCANAHIETENCGADASLTCIAPEGFAYEWRDETDSIWSTNREFMVDAGMHTFTCKVSFIEEPGCFFEISTISAPRFPVPEYTYTNVFANCQSQLTFDNTSHVMNKFEGYENHTNELCNEGRWAFRSLTTNQTSLSSYWNPTYICNPNGDSIEITYTCYIGANNACDSTRVDTVVVPNIYSPQTEYIYTTCPENPIKFDDQWFNSDTTYVGKFKNFAGCDSLSVLKLNVWPEVPDLHIHDSICSDQSVTINGVKYNTPLDNYLIMLKTKHGCDSAIYLTLTVNERLKTEFDSIPYYCSDEEQMYITFDLLRGVFDSLEIHFDTPQLRDTVIYDSSNPSVAIAIPHPEDILPGYYTAVLIFHQFCCGTHTEVRPFNIRYRSSIIEQKWNDVITLLSPKYNGGYEFTSFQWYKNGEPIIGENHSYLYQPLDMDAEYYVVVTRADGTEVATCPIKPEYHEQQTAYPTVVTANHMVHVNLDKPTKVYIYSTLGQLVKSYSLTAGDAVFQTPAQAGIYVIRYEEE